MAPNYAISAMNDPYFMQAYQTPNYYQLAAAQAQQANTAAQTADTMVTVPQQQVVQQQESSNKGLVAGGILTIGAAALCVAAHGKGAKHLKGIDKITDGFRTMGKDISKWWGVTKGTVGKKLGINQDTFQVIDRNGKTVCRMPGKTNHLYGKDIPAQLEELGFPAEIKYLFKDGKLVEGSALRRYTFKYDGFTIKVVKGEIKSIFKGSKNVTKDYINSVEPSKIAELAKINKKIAGFAEGKDIGRLSDITYVNTENGLTRFYSLDSIFNTKTHKEVIPKLQSACTRDFAINSEMADAYLTVNSEAKQFVNAMKKGELKIEDLAQAKLKVKDVGTFIVKENGEIVEVITKDGHIKAGTEEFKKLQEKYKETFENVPKRYTDYTERVYAMAK